MVKIVHGRQNQYFDILLELEWILSEADMLISVGNIKAVKPRGFQLKSTLCCHQLAARMSPWYLT